jgi:hypothetical protein
MGGLVHSSPSAAGRRARTGCETAAVFRGRRDRSGDVSHQQFHCSKGEVRWGKSKIPLVPTLRVGTRGGEPTNPKAERPMAASAIASALQR